jgi:rSAM/selenodomain-associated transferase 1
MAWTLPEDGVLGIFGKKPEPGRVKTRLAVEWGPDLAAAIHEAMLFDTLETWDSAAILTPGGRRVLAYAPDDAGPWFDQRVPASFALQPQVDGDLGRRMQGFLAGELEDGAHRVVLIGSDTPTLDPTLVISAFLCLEGRDVVLGPATDGGYYLVGVRGQVPPIFEGIDWSSPRVLSQTIDRLEDTGQSLAILPPWYDVDTPDDLRMLAGHLRALRRAGFPAGLPRLEQLCQSPWLTRALSWGRE